MAYPYNPESKISGPQMSFYDAVTLRRVFGAKTVANLGVNNNVTTTSADLWTGGTDVILLSTAETLNIVSTSANDTSVGTGARTVLVFGLDAEGLELSEVVTLNGTTNVLTTAPFFRINELIVLTAGTGGLNAGVITATSSGSSILVAHMVAGVNRAQQAHYTVPSNKYFLVRWVALSSNKGASQEFDFFYQEPGLVRTPLLEVSVTANSKEFEVPLGAYFIPLTTLFIRTSMISGTGEGSLNYVGYQVPLDYFDTTN